MRWWFVLLLTSLSLNAWADCRDPNDTSELCRDIREDWEAIGYIPPLAREIRFCWKDDPNQPCATNLWKKGCEWLGQHDGVSAFSCIKEWEATK